MIDVRFPDLNILYIILTVKILDILASVRKKLYVKRAPARYLKWTTGDKDLHCAAMCLSLLSLHMTKQYYVMLNYKHLRFDTKTFNEK